MTTDAISARPAARAAGHPRTSAPATGGFVATLAAQKREIGWRWTVFGIAVQMTMAWTLSVLVFQVGRLVV